MKKGELGELGRAFFYLSTVFCGMMWRLVTALLYVIVFPVQLVCWFKSKYGFWTTFPYMFFYTLLLKHDHEKRKAKTISSKYSVFVSLLKMLNRYYLTWKGFIQIFFLGKSYTWVNRFNVTVDNKKHDKKYRTMRFIIGLTYLLVGVLPVVLIYIASVRAKQS
jgi:hypothetical protein